MNNKLSNMLELESEGWWNNEHNIYTWPIRVSEWGARIEVHGYTEAEAKELAEQLVALSQQPTLEVVPTDLRARCIEILNWNKTGLLTGNALREFASTQWYSNNHDNLQMAVGDTAKQAYGLIASTYIEQLQMNAERYLWLRDRGDKTFPAFSARVGYSAKQCDEAIDAAIAQEGADHE